MKSVSETTRFAGMIANLLRGGDVIALTGELGSGKTTFVQALAKAIGIKEKVLSPTFVIMKSFSVRRRLFSVLNHIDCYRLSRPYDLKNLGFCDMITDKRAITAIEWANRIKPLLPKKYLSIDFKIIDSRERSLTVRDAAGGRFIHGIKK